jgi:hypothetical protein
MLWGEKGVIRSNRVGGSWCLFDRALPSLGGLKNLVLHIMCFYTTLTWRMYLVRFLG